MSRRFTLASAALLLALAGVLPLVSMLVNSLLVEGRLSVHSYAGLLGSTRPWVLLGNSLVVSSLTTAATLLIGVPLGILFGRTDLPLRRTFAAILTIPLLIPPYILAVSWADLFTPSGASGWLLSPTATRTGYDVLFGLFGCVLVFSTTFLPIVIHLTMTFLNTVNPRLEEAARLVTGWPGVLRRVTLPLIVPGISLSAMLVFLLTLGEFSVPNYLRFNVFPVESYVQFSAFYDIDAATASAIPLALIAFFVLLAEWFFLRERIHQISSTYARARSVPVTLGRIRVPAALVVSLVALIFVIVPMAVLVARSGSISAYRDAMAKASDSLLRSLLYAALGASLVTILGFFLGYLIQTRAVRIWRIVDSASIFLFALPGTVIGIGLISLWNRPLTNWLYGTFLIVVLGYAAKYTAITSRISASTLLQIPPSMEEAAQVSGIRWSKRIWSIVTPLALRGILAGWLVGFIFCLRDVEITMMVYPPGQETLPVRTLTLMANGTPELISALCVIMVAATLIPPVVVWMIFNFARWRRSHGNH